MDVLEGFKTVGGGLILIAAGAAGMAFGLVDPITGLTIVGNGLAVWGVGAKIQRLIDKPVPNLEGKLE